MSAQRSLFDVRGDDPAPTPPPSPAPAPVAAPAPAADVSSFEVKVVRSNRRKRTVAARLAGGVLEVLVPAWMSKADVDRHVDDMVRRFEKRTQSQQVDLAERARVLARRYGLPQPSSIRWVENMAHRWGSCTISDCTIRISNVLAGYPGWVLDAVIVHELCHLVHADHSPAFWALANQYPKMERARGYLIAKSGTDDESD